MADVTRRLNLTRDHDRMLMDAGYLTPIPGSPQGQYAFDAKEVDALWTKLSARVITPTPKGLVPLSTAFLRAKCNSIQIIDFLYEGRLERVGQSDTEQGYAGLLVCPRELLPLVRGPELTGLTLKEVEAKLNTPSRVINDLIREKILATERQVNPVNRCEQTVVYADDLNYFMSVYVSAHRLALDWKFGPRGVTKRLQDYGIEPAFDRDLIRASFYRRSELPPPEILGI